MGHRHLHATTCRAQPHALAGRAGVESIGLAPVERWRSLLRLVGAEGAFVGVETGAFPLDFAANVRWHAGLADMLRRRPGWRGPEGRLGLPDLWAFLARDQTVTPVRFTGMPGSVRIT